MIVVAHLGTILKTVIPQLLNQKTGMVISILDLSANSDVGI